MHLIPLHLLHMSLFLTCRALEKLSLDSQLLADVFVNYDCDLAATNLIERMVKFSILSKLIMWFDEKLEI